MSILACVLAALLLSVAGRLSPGSIGASRALAKAGARFDDVLDKRRR